MSEFLFDIVSTFPGYNSANDKTNLAKGWLTRGSVNVYKKQSGTIAVRPGLKRRGSADSTIAGVDSSYEWETSLGATRVLRVANSKLQVESDIVTSGTYLWYDLMTGLTLSRFVFDPWWNNTLEKDQIIFVKGDTNLHMWHGGIGVIASTTQIITEAGDAANQLSVWSFIGMTTANSNVFVLYYTLADVAGTRTVNVYKDSAGLNLVATGSLVGNGIITLAASGGSGLTGSVTVAYTTDDTTTSANTLTTTGTIVLTATVDSQGFNATSGSVVVNGTTYTYSGSSASTLTGVAADPTGEANGSVVVSAIVTTATSPAATFTNDFIKVIINRLHVGSYTSRLIYISDDSDYTSFSVPGTRAPGDPELLTLDNTAKGIGVRNGSAHIAAGTSDWYVITYTPLTVGSTLTEQTKMDKKSSATLQAALGHEFIGSVGDDLIFLDQGNQVRVFGTFRNLAQSQYPTLSLAIQEELADVDFTGGHLRCVGDVIYITAPITGVDYMHQTDQYIDEMGNITAQRFWQPPQVRNISRIAVIDGVVYGHSNANPQIYQLWNTLQWHDDSPTDEPLSYVCVMKTSYRSNKRYDLISFDKTYFEGYMTEGSNVYGQVAFDYQGATSLQEIVLNCIDPVSPAIFFSGVAAYSLGEAALGANPLAGVITAEEADQELVSKFRTMPSVSVADCYEFQLIVYSVDADSRWEILAQGANVGLAPEDSAVLTK